MSYYFVITLSCGAFIGLLGLGLLLIPLNPGIPKLISWYKNYGQHLPTKVAQPRSEPSFDSTSLRILKPIDDVLIPLFQTDRFDHRIFSILYLISSSHQPYAGYALWQALVSQQLKYGSMKIFHAYEYDKTDDQLLFSIANALEPGHFDINHIDQIKTPGLCLFMHHPSLLKPLRAFEKMLRVGKRLEHLLGGTLSDDKRNPLSEAALQAYRTNLLKLSDVNEEYD